MASLVFQGLLLALTSVVPGVKAGSPATCLNPQLSCANTTAVSNLCCFNAPGGQLLQTQFWDTSPSTGPSNSWTIHGLWPDHCDGTYDSNCDPSRFQTDITGVLTSFGKTDLLNYMNTYWKDSGGDDESFWEHEWDKHGTCISTLEPSCYTNYQSNEEVADFFQKVVDLFQTLDTYTTLANAGIVPSSSATYTSNEIQAAIKASFGFEVTLGCVSGALDEMWYSFEVQGSVQTGTFVPTTPDGQKSTCPSTGIKYLPKSGSPAPPPSSSTAASTTFKSVTKTATSVATSVAPSATSGTLSGNGYLNGVTSSGQTGCLISAGTWFVGGTCATYSATASGSGFHLSSSKGSCGISNNVFTCGSGVTSTVFTTSGGYLAVKGNSQFYAAAVPGNGEKETVSTSSGSVSVKFEWQSV